MSEHIRNFPAGPLKRLYVDTQGAKQGTGPPMIVHVLSDDGSKILEEVFGYHLEIIGDGSLAPVAVMKYSPDKLHNETSRVYVDTRMEVVLFTVHVRENVRRLLKLQEES